MSLNYIPVPDEPVLIYVCNPIDAWYGWLPYEEDPEILAVRKRGYRPDEMYGLQELERAALLAPAFFSKLVYWEGDGKLMLSYLPVTSDDEHLRWALAVKQQTNGTTFVMTNTEMPWLGDEHPDNEPIRVSLKKSIMTMDEAIEYVMAARIADPKLMARIVEQLTDVTIDEQDSLEEILRSKVGQSRDKGDIGGWRVFLPGSGWAFAEDLTSEQLEQVAERYDKLAKANGDQAERVREYVTARS